MLKKMIALVIAVLITFSVVAGANAISKNNSVRDEWYETRAVTTITVAPNKTLWSIAEEYKPSWMDTREYIHEVKTLNNMTTSFLDVGQALQVYIECKEYTAQGWCMDGIITTVDGNEWLCDTTTNGCAYVTFDDNGTTDNIYDDIIVEITPIE